MTLSRRIGGEAGALMIGLLVAGVAWAATGEQPGRGKPEKTPVAAETPLPSPQAKVDGEKRAFQPGFDEKGEKPLLNFFKIHDRARSVVYAIDRSGSMAVRNSLDVAKRELLTSLGQLPADSRVAVIFYNLTARILTDDQGHKGLTAASASNRKQVQELIERIKPDGGTDHITALKTALEMKPEVIVFLTDADLITNFDVLEILSAMGRTPKEGDGAGHGLMATLRSVMASFHRPNERQETRIHIVQFGRGPDLDPAAPIRRLATTTGGSYMYLDVTQMPRFPRG